MTTLVPVAGTVAHRVPARPQPLAGGYSLHALKRPTVLLAPQHAALRQAIIAVSDEAFGRSTGHLWSAKFTPDFLGALSRFYLMTGPNGELVGWSGYRARTIAGERVVYFTSTGLLSKCQGCGLIAEVQRRAIASEALHHPLLPLSIAIRTRNPHAYRLVSRTFGRASVVPALDGTVPRNRRPLLEALATWLAMEDVDTATAIAPHAYSTGEGLYARDQRSDDRAVDQLFGRLGPDDAFIVLCQVDPSIQELSRALPYQSFASATPGSAKK